MKKSLKIIIPGLTAVIVLYFVQLLLLPKYMSKPFEGALTAEYYDSEKNHQVLMVGDCELYENISPVTLWCEYGITSYIRGSAQQLVWQSYYLLEDALRYEKPDVVVFSVLAMKYNEPQKEAYNRVTIDGMRLSMSKMNAVRASRMEGEKLSSYLFPLLRYHERWKQLSAEDFKYMFTKKKVSFNGFMMRCDVKPVGWIPEGEQLTEEEAVFGGNSYRYLDKITKICKDNHIRLLLLKAPSLYPYWYDEWDEQMKTYAAKNGVQYLNTLQKIGETGLDFATDTYDAGLHLNCQGAEKLTSYLGGYLKEEYGLSDLRGDEKISAYWESLSSSYGRMKERQLSEIRESGEVKTFLVP